MRGQKTLRQATNKRYHGKLKIKVTEYTKSGIYPSTAPHSETNLANLQD